MISRLCVRWQSRAVFVAARRAVSADGLAGEGRHNAPCTRHPRAPFTSAEDQYLLDTVQGRTRNNWTRIAEDMSEKFCKRHLNVVRERYEQHLMGWYSSARFTRGEDEQIRTFVEEAERNHPGARKDWRLLQLEMPNRSRMQLCRRWMVISEMKGGFEFTSAEKQRLWQLVIQRGTEWQSIANELGKNKTRDACKLMYESMCGQLNLGLWTSIEKQRLSEALEKFPGAPWKVISEYVGTRSMPQCRYYYHKHILKRPPAVRWLPEEKDKLLKLVNANKSDWEQIALEMGKRTPHSCQVQWKKLNKAQRIYVI